ncbi:hypothetical protein CEXT_261411 [Caerostris extrusa]|uniref:Uncharacterized protein n=1 Tax=Caerostris extrusa TaxID=172846 RepID=A0AAV4U0I5_CAEEX|nr:hypothetical protein CEXT_261411 [Caerostris extrusa]
MKEAQRERVGWRNFWALIRTRGADTEMQFQNSHKSFNRGNMSSFFRGAWVEKERVDKVSGSALRAIPISSADMMEFGIYIEENEKGTFFKGQNRRWSFLHYELCAVLC